MKQLVRVDATLDPQSLSRIERLAADRGVPAATLIGEALERYLEHEAWFIKKVEEGLRDVEEGRVHSHEEVMDEMKRRFGWA